MATKIVAGPKQVSDDISVGIDLREKDERTGVSQPGEKSAQEKPYCCPLLHSGVAWRRWSQIEEAQEVLDTWRIST